MTTTNSNQQKYYLVFSGQLKKGADRRLVQAKLKKIFNNNAGMVKQLFLKKKNILQKGLSRQEADKFKRVFETSGAKCSIHAMPETQKRPKPKSTQTRRRQVISKPINISPADNSTDSNNKDDDPRINDLIKVTQFLVKVISFNQKMIWALITLVTLSIVAWGWLLFQID